MPSEPAPARHAARPGRGRRIAVTAIMALAALLAILAIFAVWANRQVLNASNWADTSTAMLEDDAIRGEVAGYLVDQVYANVDVSAEVAGALPPRLQPLAGPAANGLRGLAERTTDRVLGRPRVQEAWKRANQVTAQQFINIAEGKSTAITSQGNAVILDLRVLVLDLASQLGLPGKLTSKIPAGAGRIRIMSADQITLVQDAASAVRGLSAVLPVLAIALLALGVALSPGRRRVMLLWSGIVLIGAGAVVLVVRNLAGDQVVSSLATTDAVRPAAENAWSIGTRMLRDVAQACIIVGIPVVAAAWLAGPRRTAVSLRRWMAPVLRDQPAVAYGVAEGVLLLVVAWGPIPATRQPLAVLLMIVLVAVGVAALRRQAADEFPEVAHGTAGAALRDGAARAVGALRGRRDGAPRPGGQDARLDGLERLASLHDRGVLSDAEFAAEKAALLGRQG